MSTTLELTSQTQVSEYIAALIQKTSEVTENSWGEVRRKFTGVYSDSSKGIRGSIEDAIAHLGLSVGAKHDVVLKLDSDEPRSLIDNLMYRDTGREYFNAIDQPEDQRRTYDEIMGVKKTSSEIAVRVKAVVTSKPAKLAGVSAAVTAALYGYKKALHPHVAPVVKSFKDETIRQAKELQAKVVDKVATYLEVVEDEENQDQ